MASAASLGVFPPSYDATPKETIADFYRRDPTANLDRIYAKLIKASPDIQLSQAKLRQAKSDLDQAELNLQILRRRRGDRRRDHAAKREPGQQRPGGRGTHGDPLADRDLGRRQFQGDPVAQPADRSEGRSGSRHVWQPQSLSRHDYRLHHGDRLDAGPASGPKRDGQLHQGRPAPAGADRLLRLRPRQGSSVYRPLRRAARLVQGETGRRAQRGQTAATADVGSADHQPDSLPEARPKAACRRPAQTPRNRAGRKGRRP